MKNKNNTDHCTIRNGNLLCMNCGGIYKMGMPMALSVFTYKMKSFSKLHADCPKTWTTIPEPDMTTSREVRIKWWAEHGEHGTSSKTIWSFMVINVVYPEQVYKMEHLLLNEVLIPPSKYHLPSDPDDFRRCYLLLKCIPEWNHELHKMQSLSPVWHKLIANWQVLTNMLEQQLQTKKDNGMYELMKQIGC